MCVEGRFWKQRFREIITISNIFDYIHCYYLLICKKMTTELKIYQILLSIMKFKLTKNWIEEH